MSQVSTFLPAFAERIIASFKMLLEHKHLYQNQKIDIEDLNKLIPEQWREPAVSETWREFIEFSNLSWVIQDPAGRKIPFPDGHPELRVYLTLPSVKLFCNICDRTEAYNLVGSKSLDYNFDMPISYSKNTVQQITASYQCQSCKTDPESFLIRREGLKLIHCGRSPIEKVEVHRDIPREVTKYLSNAIISHNSGFTLAGIFYLRTLIEQWVYSLNNTHPSADKAIEWYMTTLPDDFKQRFKSLKQLYSDLSADLHSASGSEELFNQTVVDIIEHFEARRINKFR